MDLEEDIILNEQIDTILVQGFIGRFYDIAPT